MAADPVDHLGLCGRDDRDDPHGPAALAAQRVDLEHLLDEARPGGAALRGVVRRVAVRRRGGRRLLAARCRSQPQRQALPVFLLFPVRLTEPFLLPIRLYPGVPVRANYIR